MVEVFYRIVQVASFLFLLNTVINYLAEIAARFVPAQSLRGHRLERRNDNKTQYLTAKALGLLLP